MILVDLFSGCGGFSLGARQAGFDVAAAFDIDPILTSAYSFNFPQSKLLLADVSKLTRENVLEEAGEKIDGIIGGPPCQGFSDIGLRNSKDPRRQLVVDYFRVISEIRPKFFVMENVRGLAYSDARELLDSALALVSDAYDLLGPIILNAADFGAATNRKRLFVIGTLKKEGAKISLGDIDRMRRPAVTVRAAIGDLVGAGFIGDCEDGFDTWKITKPGRHSSYSSMLRSKGGRFTSHRPTRHTSKVQTRFSKVAQGEFDVIGRHPRLHWDSQCPTLRAGTGADRGSFQSVRPLHPDENRVITVREGARLQGFPDSHRFHPTVWHSFRMIGNSVSPIISKAIFSVIAEKFRMKSAVGSN